MRRATSRAAALVALLAVAITSRVGAQPAPYRNYSTLATTHFRVHTTPDLLREGRVVAAVAERAYAQLSRELVPPRGTVDIVLSGDADFANGSASTFPTNRIVVFAHPPLENENLRVREDWLTLVVTHELAHVFHLDRSRGIWSAAQHVFGRAPLLFPNSYAPAWLVEGLAVYYESRLTEGGRLRGTQHPMLARAAAREGHLPRLDELSLANVTFPLGDAAYAYGSLFIDYLARTRGAEAIPRFVEHQSAQLIPFMVDRSASQGLGLSFSDAFAAWSDSVRRSVDTTTAPLAGWRELSERSLYAPAPRWLNDTTLVYSASGGRETNAAYTLTLGGTRTRLGRRDGVGANAPSRDGSLVYSSLEYTATSEVRSDLYRQWPDGHVQRLTYGQSVSQPDVRFDGTIVAVRSQGNASELVIVSSNGDVATLKGASSGETWSEPRWSPDNRYLVAVHRIEGSVYSLEVIDPGVSPGATTEIASGRYLISSPSWTPDGEAIVYVSEERGVPELASVTMHSDGGRFLRGMPPTGKTVGIVHPELSRDARWIAAVSLRADGYHVGIARFPPTLSVNVRDSVASLPNRNRLERRAAEGDYTPYSAWRTVLPRYWYPLVESSAEGGTRLGATTSGYDVLFRHLYSAYVAVSTSGRYPVAGISYRYGGFAKPFVDVGLAQDWISLGRLENQSGAFLGTLLRRTRDASLSFSFIRPRVRTFSSATVGLGVEHRSFATDPSPLFAQLDTSLQHGYTYPRAFVGATWSNLQRPPLSISPEDGISLAFTARERLRTDAPSVTASTSVVGAVAGYKSLDLPGFAHHVLALRLAAGFADRKTSTALEVGGISGNVIEIVPGYTIGEGRRTFGVRGFPTAALYGTQAATASLEYRAPLTLDSRGLGLLPLFLDRSSLTLFADAGVAGCASNPLYPGVCGPLSSLSHTIASVGTELSISAAVLDWDSPQLIRIGVAVPVASRSLSDRTSTFYLAFGFPF